MKLSKLLLLLCLVSLVACSNKAVKKDEASDELSGADSADFIVDADNEDLENIVEEVPEEISDSSEMSDTPEMAAAQETMIEEMGQYTVEKNDTLMFVAFKIYGDYGKWKELSRLNPDLAVTDLKEGDVLKYNIPAERFEWNPQGNPYLIKRNQTLGIISNEVYGVPKRWRDIYNNNRPMIKDPNLIFAGFTLYYIPDREIASEKY